MRLATLGVAFLIAVAAAFNLGKAVHIDDTAYLELARGILHHPLHPMSTVINWASSPEPAYIGQNQPALFYYLLALVMWVFGESELALHAMMAVISGLAIVAFYRVARRIAPAWPLALTALFALSPAFLPGQNLMTDVPLALASLVCFDALLLAHADSAKGRRHYIIGACAIATACLIKYSALTLIPAFACVIAYRRQWRMAWTLAIPAAALGVWSGWNYLEYGGVHLLSRPAVLQVSEVGARAIDWVGSLGVAIPAGTCLFVRERWAMARLATWIAPVLGGLTMFFVERALVPLDLQQAWLWGLGTFSGLAALIVAGAATWRDWRSGDAATRDRVVVLASWWASAVLVIVLAPFMAMRHVLPALAPMLLLTGRSSAGRPPQRTLLAALAATAVLGCALAAADYAFADLYRRYPASIARALPNDGTRVWTVGHWGWQWYTTQLGWLPYDEQHIDLRPGDSVVATSVISTQVIRAEAMSRLRVVATYPVPPHGITYLRTFRRGGYYGTSWRTGAFPFHFSSRLVDLFTVFRVDR